MLTYCECFQNLNKRFFHMKFSKAIKCFLSGKSLTSNKLLLLKEKGNLISNDKLVATKMNNFSINTTF